MANFNGHNLPPLPDWNKSKYPYAIITDGGDWYLLTVFDKMGHVGPVQLSGSSVQLFGITLGATSLQDDDSLLFNYDEFVLCKNDATVEYWREYGYELSTTEWVFFDTYQMGLYISADDYSLEDGSRVNTLIWTNTTLCRENGEVYMVGAPEPADVTNLESWLAGYIAGLADGYARKKAQFYLYNGVKLPALPEWDREAYPYALIVTSTYMSNTLEAINKSLITLYCFDTPTHFLFGYSSEKTLSADADGSTFGYISVFLKFNGEIYDNPEFTERKETTMLGIYPRNAIWSNYDVYHNRSICMTEYEPIPVYE